MATDRDSDMKTDIKTFELRHLIAVTAHGTLDLVASKAALKSLVAAPGFDAMSEVLLDLRDVKCDMSVTDIHALVAHMAWHIPVLFDDHRIAVLVNSHTPGSLAFNHAQFLELCAGNNGLHIHAFEDHDRATEWLNADFPNGPFGTSRAKEPASSNLGRRPQFGLA